MLLAIIFTHPKFLATDPQGHFRNFIKNSNLHFHAYILTLLQGISSHHPSVQPTIFARAQNMSLITEEVRAKAVIYHDKQVIKEQCQRLLREVGLPNGLLPMDDAEECGHVEETGFVWLKQKKKSEHRFEKIGRLVSYGTEVTAYAEPTKIKKLTGVKSRELLIWITINEINVPFMNAEKVSFKSSTGISKTFPADAFVAEGANVAKEVNNKVENVSESVASAQVKEV